MADGWAVQRAGPGGRARTQAREQLLDVARELYGVVGYREDGAVTVLAGQAHDAASQYASEELARRAALDGVGPLPPYPPWMDRLAEPGRVLFAHDCAELATEPRSGSQAG
ncbi:hypothetical protein ACIQD5_28995 [Streptomyces microflavus]|uniref:hypothetical protein n=1 Tax=Streptomyces microflavus TaxID=1919 RepID=UPI00380DD0B8